MLALVISGLAALCLVYSFYWKRRGLPPGPTPLPLFGNAITLDRLSPGYEAYRRWTLQYGPVFTFWFGCQPVVAVTDYETIVKTFIKDPDAYEGRDFFTEFIGLIRGSQGGIFITEGPLWRENRRFMLRLLRECGMGQAAMEEMVQIEVADLVERVKTDISNGVSVHDLAAHVDHATGSLINQILFGYRFAGRRNKEFVELKGFLHKFMVESMRPASLIVMTWPTLRHLPLFSRVYANLHDAWQPVMRFIDRQIDDYQARTEAGKEPETLAFAGHYFRARRQMQKSGGDPAETFVFRDDALRHFCADLWAAGQETTSLTISFGLLYLLHHQEVQQKVHEELDAVIGTNRQIRLADKAKLPYLNAVINEVQRLCNLLPTNLTHRTTRDVVVNGFKLPKGTAIVPQISCVLYDEKIFPEPMEFRPERFLDARGQLKKVDALVPFSVGKRQCLGETLARVELFLFFANICHQFKIFPVQPFNPPSVEKISGITVRPHPYQVKLALRHVGNRKLSYYYHVVLDDLREEVEPHSTEEAAT